MLRLAALLAFTSVLAACGSSVEESDRSSGGPSARRAPAASVTPSARLQAADGRSSFAIIDGELRRFSTQTGRVTRTYPLAGAGS